jgi:hypothetical protein
LIKFLPNEFLKKYAPESKIKKLLTKNFSINKIMLNSLSDNEFINKKELSSVVLKAAKFYKKKTKELIKDGESNSMAKKEALNNHALITQRVQDTVVFSISDKIKEDYNGEFYIWLPSDAEEPDPLHQLNYGKKFQVGEGEQPCERFGCRCGMQILTGDSTKEFINNNA